MIKTFGIEFVKVALLQTLYKAHIEDEHMFGGDNQMSIISFYEQVKNQDEVDRFVDVYRDLSEQQNRTGLIGNGIIVSPENPSITNLYSCLIIPMTFTCSIRTKLSNRDQMIETINNLIYELKGSKVDMAQLESVDDDDKKCYVPFMVGTIGHNDNAPMVNSGDYIGDFESETPTSDDILSKINEYVDLGIADNISAGDYLYFSYDNTKLLVAYCVNDSVELEDVNIEDINFDSDGDGNIIVNGTLSFNTQNTYTSLPIIETFIETFAVEDGNNTETVNVECSVESGYALDDDGYVEGSATFSFTIVESEWDMDNIVVSGEDVYEQPQKAFAIVSDEQSYPNVIFPSEHTDFEKYKVSLSFDAIRCDEPRTLNGDDYCEISFGGSATLVNESVMLGNDLIKVGISKNKIVASSDITLSGDTYYLEPLELPSGSNANTVISQLMSNNFKQNTHTDGLSINLQYSFILDTSIDLLSQWFNYARYGTYGITTSDISPNMIYNVTEYWSTWGNVSVNTVLAKIIESMDIENTEGDTLTIGVNMQIQGENN